MAAQIGVPALPRPTHYLFRPDGTITAVIAVDELPESIRLSGVPRLLTPADTQGLTSLGVYPRAGSQYIEERTSEVPAGSPKGEGSEEGEAVESVVDPVENWRRAIARPESKARETPVGSVASLVLSTRASQSARPSLSSRARPATRGPASTISPASVAGAPSVRAGGYPGGNPYNPVVPGKFREKIYCTHWIRTGSCDFIQQGCIYKHEVPSLEALREIGFLEWPRWIRERGGVTELGESDNARRRRLALEREAKGEAQPAIGSFHTRLNSLEQAPMYGPGGPNTTFGDGTRPRGMLANRGWRGGFGNQGYEHAYNSYGQHGGNYHEYPQHGGHWAYQRGNQRGNPAYAPYRGQFRPSAYRTNNVVNFPVRPFPATRGARVTEIVETSDAKTALESSSAEPASSESVATVEPVGTKKPAKAEEATSLEVKTGTEETAAAEKPTTTEIVTASPDSSALALTTTTPFRRILTRPTPQAEAPLPARRDDALAREMEAAARREELYIARRERISAARGEPVSVSPAPPASPAHHEPTSTGTEPSPRRRDAPSSSSPGTATLPSGPHPPASKPHRAPSHASSHASSAPLRAYQPLAPTPLSAQERLSRSSHLTPPASLPAKPASRDLYDGLPSAPRVAPTARFRAPDSAAVLAGAHEQANLATRRGSYHGGPSRAGYAAAGGASTGDRSHAAAIAGWQMASTGGIEESDRRKAEEAKKAHEEQKRAGFSEWKAETLWKEKVRTGDAVVVKKGVVSTKIINPAGTSTSSAAALPAVPAPARMVLRPTAPPFHAPAATPYRAPDAAVSAAAALASDPVLPAVPTPVLPAVPAPVLPVAPAPVLPAVPAPAPTPTPAPAASVPPTTANMPSLNAAFEGAFKKAQSAEGKRDRNAHARKTSQRRDSDEERLIDLESVAGSVVEERK